jgi:biotin synthase
VSSVTGGLSIESVIPTSIPRNSVFQQAIEATEPRTNWTREEIQQIYDTPLIELAFAAVSSPH